MQKKSKNTQHSFEIFVEFLRRKGYLAQYRRSVRNRFGNFTSYVNRFHPLFYLQYGFTWISTPEGFEFWSDLNEEWMKYCKKQNLK